MHNSKYFGMSGGGMGGSGAGGWGMSGGTGASTGGWGMASGGGGGGKKNTNNSKKIFKRCKEMQSTGKCSRGKGCAYVFLSENTCYSVS